MRLLGPVLAGSLRRAGERVEQDLRDALLRLPVDDDAVRSPRCRVG